MRKFTKNLSRILCGALSVCTILATATVPAMAFPRYDFKTAENETGLVPATEVLFYENFDNLTHDNVRYPVADCLGLSNGKYKWDLTSTPKVRFLIAGLKNPNKSGVGNTLYVQPHGAEEIKTAIFKTKDAEAYTGNYSIEFNFSRQTAGSVPLLYGAGYSTTLSSVENYAIQLYIGEDNKLYYKDADGVGKAVVDTRAYKVNNQRGEGTRFGSYASDELAVDADGYDHNMYIVKLDVRTAEKKYDLYLNGTLCAKNVTFMNADSIECINVPFALTPGTTATIRYDEMKVYREPLGVTNMYANDFNKEGVSWSVNDKTKPGFAGLGLSIESARGHVIRANGSKIYTNSVGSTSGAGLIIEGMIADDDVTYDVDFEYTPDASSTGKYAPIIGVGGEGQPGIVLSAGNDGGIYCSRFNGYSSSKPNFEKLGEFADKVSLKGHITLHVDFINSNCDLYIDNKLIAKDMSINLNPAATLGIIENGAEYWLCLGNYLNAWKASGNTVNDATFIDDGSYWDNLRISKNVRENIIADVLPTDEDVAVHTAAVKVNLVSSDIEGYTVEWSCNNPNFKINTETGEGVIDRDAEDGTVTLTATVKDENAQQVLTRTVDIAIPKRTGIAISRDAITSVSVIAYNAPNTTNVIAALYDSETGELKYVKTLPCNETKKTATISEIANGTYNAKGFVLEMDTLRPVWYAERANIVVNN